MLDVHAKETETLMRTKDVTLATVHTVVLGPRN